MLKDLAAIAVSTKLAIDKCVLILRLIFIEENDNATANNTNTIIERNILINYDRINKLATVNRLIMISHID